MGSTLVIADELWHQLRDHVLADGDEHVAFVLAKAAGERLLARETILIPDDKLERQWDSVSLRSSALLDVMNTAVRKGLALVEAHSHPLSVGEVDFSLIDDRGQEELVAYLSDVMPGQPYGAIVIGQDAIRGKVWRAGEAGPMTRIVVTGEVLHQWPGDGTPPAAGLGAGLKDRQRHDRQVLALGGPGHAWVSGTRVAIVGLGGIGSIVALELAHLGVQDIVMIDADVVEESNLGRLAGATPGDVRRAKVSVAAEHVSRINPRIHVTPLQANLREESAIKAAASADVLFGCIDTDSGRLILNELALAHMVPYIDCGVGIDAPDGTIREAGGQTIVWVPGRPCLLCGGEIDLTIAAEELESPEQQGFRRRHGYVAGTTVPEPAVMSLNGVIASLAVTEFLALVAGFRPSNYYTYYDMLEQRVGPRLVQRAPAYVACSLEGAGGQADLERFSRQGLPADAPRLV